MSRDKFSKQLAGLRQKRQLMVILVFFFVVVITWTMISLFTSQKKLSISKDFINLAKPLSPTLDETAIAKLESKRAYSQEELRGFTIFKVISTKDGKVSRLVEITSEKEVLDISPTPAPTIEPTITPAMDPITGVLLDI